MVLAIICVVWVLATLAGTMREFLDDKNEKVYGVIVTVNFFFVPLTIILGAYGTIFQIARAHARGRGVSSFKKVLHFLLAINLLNGARELVTANTVIPQISTPPSNKRPLRISAPPIGPI